MGKTRHPPKGSVSDYNARADTSEVLGPSPPKHRCATPMHTPPASEGLARLDGSAHINLCRALCNEPALI